MYIMFKGKLKMKKICFLLFVITLITLPVFVSALEAPEEISFSDFSGIISDGTKNYVKSKNEILFAQTEAKIIFVTTDSTDGLTTGEYTKNLYSAWGVGQIGRGNSVLIVISPKTKDYGIIQGKNIRRVLDDSTLYKFVAEDFEPHFAKGNYDEAVLCLYNRIGKWYEETYNNLNLGLDENTENYKTYEITKDIEKSFNKIFIWIGLGVAAIFALVFFKIKRNRDFKARQQERKLKRKRTKANIDKIVNS